jgi:anti-sigma factor RsiW
MLWECQVLRRRFDKHIDNDELNALVPSLREDANKKHGLSPDVISEAERHARSCPECSSKVTRYRHLINQLAISDKSEPAPPGTDCPKDNEVDWSDVAAGQYPEIKAAQLIMHAALCDHCGPLLRAAASVSNTASRVKKMLREPRKRLQPDLRLSFWPKPFWPVITLLGSTLAIILIAGVLSSKRSSPPATLSAAQFTELAVNTHAQYVQGRLTLDVRSDSQQRLNEWFKSKSQFSLTLPASPPLPGEEWPYRLEGARLMQVGDKSAVFIYYRPQRAQLQLAAASVMVTPASVAVASGGTEVHFKKVSFHYTMVGGYKVVTWSVHGLTYALVSQEGTNTQQSCMVCHSAMRDRDLSRTPTPVQTRANIFEPVSQ